MTGVPGRAGGLPGSVGFRVGLVGAAVLGLVLGAAACGGGDDAASDLPEPAGGADGAIDLSDPAAGPESPSGRTLLEGFTEVEVRVTTGAGTVLDPCLLLADEAAEWGQGLMEVIDLGDYPGMVFAFDEDRTGTFFMRNTPTPLSIAFLDAGGRLVSSTDMEPCEDRDGCPTYGADGPYRYAVEVPRGMLATVGLDDPDAVLELGGDCDPV